TIHDVWIYQRQLVRVVDKRLAPEPGCEITRRESRYVVGVVDVRWRSQHHEAAQAHSCRLEGEPAKGVRWFVVPNQALRHLHVSQPYAPELLLARASGVMLDVDDRDL